MIEKVAIVGMGALGLLYGSYIAERTDREPVFILNEDRMARYSDKIFTVNGKVVDPAMQKAAAAPEAQGYARQRYEQEGYSAGYAQAQQSQQSAAGYQQQAQRSSGSYQQPAQNYQQAQQSASYEAPQQPAPRTFSTESPTARFFAQGTQRNHPISMASAVAGSFTGSYAATGTAGQVSGRYRAVDYPQ